jgi:hypothetical protein
MATKDITGLTFGRLTALYRVTQRHGEWVWRCRCVCGRLADVKGSLLRRGDTRSCGCLRDELQRKHGRHDTPEYEAWESLIQRCTNPKNPKYARYGARGITVCQRWRQDFATFLADMGPRPSPQHSIERRANDEGYSPANCYWATEREQRRNRCNNHHITFRGETLCITDWALRVGLLYQVIDKRLKHGWSVEEALTTPAGKGRRHQKTFVRLQIK